jgi:RHS repeat-associated protein
MTSTNYSDTTPDIAMAYDALGRQTAQSNGLSTSTFSYNSSNLQLDTETIAYNLDGQPGADFTRVIDRSQDTLSRESGWQLKNGTTIENDVQYQYSVTQGRLSKVRRGDIPVPQEFDYTYTAQSNLIASITSPAHTVSNAYEPDRNILRSKVNKKLDTTPVSSYFYTMNHYGQRIGVATGGIAFTGSPSWVWGYNDKGEIVKADHSTNTNFSRAYAYDGIGNRTSGGGLNPPSQTSYTANILNQYSAINSLNPVHDDDGNMTSGPLPANVNANSTLLWDAENRLIEAQVNSGATVNFVYDSQSRRIAETLGGATTIYVYDGWNPIAEYNTTYVLTKSYTWGLDLSGSMQGAGGVGGLLSVTDSTGTYFPTFDGNGNVSEYLDTNGDFVAHYEYDPFGKTVVATGSKAQDFAHRFSTKPLDLTTGLYYYGYRFYDPETGRWPSRDPIEEEGGINLYGFVGNDGVGGVDVLGMEEMTKDDLDSLLKWLKEDTNNTEGSNEKCAQPRQLFMEMSVPDEVSPPWDPRKGPQKFGVYRNNTGGWTDQWGQQHRFFCMVCHGAYPEAQRNMAGILGGDVGWAIFYTDIALMAAPPAKAAGGGAIRLFSRQTPKLTLSQAKYALTTAKAPWKDSTVIGHALSKHTGKAPAIWGKIHGHKNTWHGQAMKHFREIYDAPGGFKKVNDKGLYFLEKRLPDGRGIRLQLDYKFKGFVE